MQLEWRVASAAGSRAKLPANVLERAVLPAAVAARSGHPEGVPAAGRSRRSTAARRSGYRYVRSSPRPKPVKRATARRRTPTFLTCAEVTGEVSSACLRRRSRRPGGLNESWYRGPGTFRWRLAEHWEERCRCACGVGDSIAWSVGAVGGAAAMPLGLRAQAGRAARSTYHVRRGQAAAPTSSPDHRQLAVLVARAARSIVIENGRARTVRNRGDLRGEGAHPTAARRSPAPTRRHSANLVPAREMVGVHPAKDFADHPHRQLHADDGDQPGHLR